MDRVFSAIERVTLPKRMVYADSEDQGGSGCPKRRAGRLGRCRDLEIGYGPNFEAIVPI
jgi:hypothetical protein